MGKRENKAFLHYYIVHYNKGSEDNMLKRLLLWKVKKQLSYEK